MTTIGWRIPAEEHPVWVAREAAVAGGVTAILLAAAAAEVQRRRPS